MRIAICDDDDKFCIGLKKQIEQFYQSLDVLVDTYQSGIGLLAHFKGYPYDLVFLDIEMPAMDGLLLAKKLREISEEVLLIFMTGHIEYALNGYEVNALRYLTKPVNENKLKEVLHYVMEQERKKHFLWLKTQAGEERVAVSEILYLEARDQNINICTKKQNYLVRYNLKDYERELKEYGFFRIHRGYLIALGKVKGIGRQEVTLEGDIRLAVSRSKEKKLREALYQYIKMEAV